MGDEWIASRLAALCARPDGRISRLRIHHHAARTAVLIDLARLGRLTRYLQSTVVDTTPTGFAPADRLLAHIDDHPDHTMLRVLRGARVRMSDVVDGDGPHRWWWPATGRVDPEQMRVERARVDAAARGDCDSPATAALTLIAHVLEAVEVAEPGALLGECAGMAWMVENGLAYLTDMRERCELAAAGPSGGSG